MLSMMLKYKSAESSSSASWPIVSPLHTVEEVKEDARNIQAWIVLYEHRHEAYIAQRARCEKLMHRKSVKNLQPAKVARLTQRLMEANKVVERTEEELDRLRYRLSQLNTNVTIDDAAK